MKNVWVPLGTFLLAVALSILTASPKPLSARPPGQESGCECKLNVIEQSGSIKWVTSNVGPAPLSKAFIQNTANLCVASTKPKEDWWTVRWTATNLRVLYSYSINKVPTGAVTAIVPFEYARDVGHPPCKPGVVTAGSGHVHNNTLERGAQAAVVALLTPQHPPGTRIDVEIMQFTLLTSFDWTLNAEVTCGLTAGPLALSIATYTEPKNVKEGEGANRAVYQLTCP